MTAPVNLVVFDLLAVLGVLAFAVLLLIGVVVLAAAFAPRSWVRASCRLLRIPIIDADQAPDAVVRDIQRATFVDQAARFGLVELPEQEQAEVQA